MAKFKTPKGLTKPKITAKQRKLGEFKVPSKAKVLGKGKIRIRRSRKIRLPKVRLPKIKMRA